MAATNYTPIYLYNSGTATNVPVNSNLGNGELAINYTDGKLFYKDNTGTVQVIATKATSALSIPVSATQGGTGVANNVASTITISGSFGTTLTVTGTTAVTLPTSGTLVNTAVTTLSSLTSVGTIATGVWNGTIITGTYGGTGVNNGSNTITLGGSFTTSGAFTTTLTVTANTNVTLPTTGTLATLAGSETFTNKTLTNPTVTNYVETLQAVGTVAGTSTLVLTTGTVLTATLTASTACTFTLPAQGAGKSFILKLTQAATGMTTATFVAPTGAIKWPGGTAPTITATASAVDILSFVSDGTNWYGTFAQAFA